MTTPMKTIRVRNMPDGNVRLDLDNGAAAVGVELSWRLALRLALRLHPAIAALAVAEGMSEAEFDALFDAETDQVAAELGGGR